MKAIDTPIAALSLAAASGALTEARLSPIQELCPACGGAGSALQIQIPEELEEHLFPFAEDQERCVCHVEGTDAKVAIVVHQRGDWQLRLILPLYGAELRSWFGELLRAGDNPQIVVTCPSNPAVAGQLLDVVGLDLSSFSSSGDSCSKHMAAILSSTVDFAVGLIRKEALRDIGGHGTPERVTVAFYVPPEFRDSPVYKLLRAV